MASKEGWVEVFRTHDQMEAELIKGLLTTNGFPVVVQPKGAKTMPVIFGHSAPGQLVLTVPSELAEQARALLEAEVEEEPGAGH